MVEIVEAYVVDDGDEGVEEALWVFGGDWVLTKELVEVGNTVAEVGAEVFLALAVFGDGGEVVPVGVEGHGEGEGKGCGFHWFEGMPAEIGCHHWI